MILFLFFSHLINNFLFSLVFSSFLFLFSHFSFNFFSFLHLFLSLFSLHLSGNHSSSIDPHNVKRGLFFSHGFWLFKRAHPLNFIKEQSIDDTQLMKDPLVQINDKYIPLFFVFFSFFFVFSFFVFSSFFPYLSFRIHCYIILLKNHSFLFCFSDSIFSPHILSPSLHSFFSFAFLFFLFLFFADILISFSSSLEWSFQRLQESS